MPTLLLPSPSLGMEGGGSSLQARLAGAVYIPKSSGADTPFVSSISFLFSSREPLSHQFSTCMNPRGLRGPSIGV